MTMDAETLRLLLAIDENKSISQIAREIGMDEPPLKKGLAKLMALKLIAPVKKAGPFLNGAFIEKLRFSFVKMVGPLGHAFFEDVVEDMNLSISKIPAARTAELVKNLSMEIGNRSKRAQFQESMASAIRNQGKK
ncbi:MAG: hypothetical protein GY859_17095 [Desulfobacterales bacterium]|nr:hypothetical protein [Desulfobacterales bacterium]